MPTPEGLVRVPESLLEGALAERVVLLPDGDRIELTFIDANLNPEGQAIPDPYGAIGTAVARVWMARANFERMVEMLASAGAIWRDVGLDDDT
jgi:hypothetical protein